MGYSKLFNEILTSTIWSEPSHVRIVWITILALKDRNHVAQASLPGLAHLARVTLDQCKEAISVLESPDEFSRTKEHNGRRIKEVDGGWLVLNGEKYRDKMNLDERREYNRVKQSEYRSKEKEPEPCVFERVQMSNNVKECQSSSNNVTECHPMCTLSAHTDTDTDTDTDINISADAFFEEEKIPLAKRSLRKNAPSRVKKTKNFESENFKAFWLAYPRKQDKQKSIEVWIRQDLDSKFPEIMKGLMREIKTPQWIKDQGQFIPHPKTWLNNQRWETALNQIEIKSSADAAIEAFLSEP